MFSGCSRTPWKDQHQQKGLRMLREASGSENPQALRHLPDKSRTVTIQRMREAGAPYSQMARRSGTGWAIMRKMAGAWEQIVSSPLFTKVFLQRVITPYIDFDNVQRVYITYYPDNNISTSIFLYGFTLLWEDFDWYVESVSFGEFSNAAQVFKATVINLGSRITSIYSFDQTTEQVLNSEETPNHFKMLKASEFSLVEFKQSFDLIVD